MVKGNHESEKKGPISIDYTLHLNKMVHGVQFKKRAPRAIREIKKFAAKVMSTEDVRVDTKLNKELWSKGVRNIPHRIRVRLSRKASEEEGAEGEMFTLVQYVPCTDFTGLQTERVHE